MLAENLTEQVPTKAAQCLRAGGSAGSAVSCCMDGRKACLTNFNALRASKLYPQLAAAPGHTQVRLVHSVAPG